MMSASRRYPGQTDEAFPDPFITIPPQPAQRKPGQLSQDQLRQFFEEGYVVLEDFFDRALLDACKDAIDVLVEGLAQRMYKAGLIKNLYKEYDLFKRLTMMEKEYPGTTVILTKHGSLPQAFRDLWSNDHLLNVIEQLIGPNIVGHPVWNMRTKTPKNEATTVPWHQDVGYLESESYKVLTPTAWIPLLDANEENGCLQFIRRGHQSGQICTHQCCFENTWYVWIDEAEMEKKLGIDMASDVVTVPVKYGGLVLFNNIIPHRSLSNTSENVRWSFDFRWQRPEDPIGFYGLKEGVRMRTTDNPNHTIDWESFNSVDRSAEQHKSLGKSTAEFDTTVHGPWMKQWEIVHANKHTAGIGVQ